MAKGFKDSKGKFRPTEKREKGVSSKDVSNNPEPNNTDSKKADEIKNKKITMKQFIDSGNFLEDEVRRRADKGSPHFFDKDTMRFFSSRISELMWKDANRNIWFITSEADKGSVQHSGSVRAFTVRKIDESGDILKVGEFQGHATLGDARSEIKDIIGLGNK